MAPHVIEGRSFGYASYCNGLDGINKFWISNYITRSVIIQLFQREHMSTDVFVDNPKVKVDLDFM